LSNLALSVPGLEIVLITNNANEPTRPHGTGFIEEVSDQIGGIPFYHPTDSLKGKTKADLFNEAIKNSTNNATPEHAAHIDDQFKSLKGLNAAGFDTFFWTLPYGKHQHLGVKCMRPAERLGRVMIGSQQRVSSIYRNGLFE
ncbi:MAG: HAD family hydrolase, partial [Candidatus Saccharimonadales bacterium]